MEKIILFILLITVCSCKKAHNDTNKISIVQSIDSPIKKIGNVEEILLEPIDTIEFVSYWKQFRRAVLEHDTTVLATMINDSIIDGWFLLHDYTVHTNKLNKSIVLEHFYTLFSPAFLSILQSYDIHKDLFSYEGKYRGKKYLCTRTIGNRTYQSKITFISDWSETGKIYKSTVEYFMSFSYDGDNINNCITRKGSDVIFIEEYTGPLNNISFHLEFIKTQGGIKLNKIWFSYISVSE